VICRRNGRTKDYGFPIGSDCLTSSGAPRRQRARRGLLREPARPLNGIRRYAAADVSRLRFIKHAQQSGFTLDEVQALLGLSGRPACKASRTLAAKKLLAIEEKMRILVRLRRELRAWVAACDANTRDSCPALEKLAH
jgi:MerR family transcriptional regulator, mercuric resistance operon regulatory protein